MIKISRKEADMLRKQIPEAHIAVVNRQHRSKEKTYYAEENRKTIPLIFKMRGKPIPREYTSQPGWNYNNNRRQYRGDWR